MITSIEAFIHQQALRHSPIYPRIHTLYIQAIALRFLDPRQWPPGQLSKADFKRREKELPTQV